MKILITGAKGFIGKNLVVRLSELSEHEIVEFVRNDTVESLRTLVSNADAIIHLAGENRPADSEDFSKVNVELTQSLCQAIKESGRSIPLLFTSSIHAEKETPYGTSKHKAEKIIEQLATENNVPAVIYRLPGVFGKWCRPDYNSVVATFCHNAANDLSVQVNDPDAALRLVYIDDVITHMVAHLAASHDGVLRAEVTPEYSTTVGALRNTIESFGQNQKTLEMSEVGTGLMRALYATYVSYLPKEKFIYDLDTHSDERGSFAEIMKTETTGQFSYFTAVVGATRGKHYHHSKTEKFLVIQGNARFRHRHILTNEIVELHVSGSKPQIMETIPGWAHEITNVGDCELLVLLWSNEVFDKNHPDTIACRYEYE